MHLSRRALLAAAAVSPLSSPRLSRAQTYALASVDALTPLNVTTSTADHLGRRAVRVRLTDAAQKSAIAAQTGNGATLAFLPGVYRDFSATVMIAGEVNGLGAADSRAFVGLAFRARPDGEKFDAIYLRMTNGTLAQPAPPAPRNVRAIQYVARPDLHFSKSRQEAPGVYEKGAPVGPGRWHRLRIEVTGASARAYIDDNATASLVVNDLRSGADGSGQIALFVDDGTDGFFSDLTVVGR